VVGDAAYASRAKMTLMQEVGYWSVFALPRTTSSRISHGACFACNVRLPEKSSSRSASVRLCKSLGSGFNCAKQLIDIQLSVIFELLLLCTLLFTFFERYISENIFNRSPRMENSTESF